MNIRARGVDTSNGMWLDNDMNATHTTRPDSHNKSGLRCRIVARDGHTLWIEKNDGVTIAIDAAVFAAIYKPLEG